MARLEPTKYVVETIELALEAAKGQVAYVGDWEYVVGKRSKNWQAYLNRFYELRKNPRLVCTPNVPNREVVEDWLGRSKTFVNLSPIECDSVSPYEAGLVRTPTIVQNSGGLPEVVSELPIHSIIEFKRSTMLKRVEMLREAIYKPYSDEDLDGLRRVVLSQCGQIGAWATKYLDFVRDLIAS
jgi:glycosyltransferase involved in cell wall biosynthesis